MRFVRVCLMVAGLGLLLMLTSCSSEISKEDTETFLAGLSTMMGQAMTDESTQIIIDFRIKQPPDPGVTSYIEILEEASIEKLRNPDPYSLGTLYGTWRYKIGEGWYLYSSGDPANAILFEWSYLDTASVPHAAEILIDSLEFYEDSLPTNVWVGVGTDGSWLAWLKLEVAYLSLEEINEVSLTYEIVDQMQIGISMTSNVPIDTNFTGTVSLWAIDRTSNNYRIDLDITVANDYPEEIVLSDSDGWEMNVSFLEVVETDIVDDVVYEKRNVSGEITKDGNHAADISGYVWEPEDDMHTSEIVVIFSDGTEGNLKDYFASGYTGVPTGPENTAPVLFSIDDQTIMAGQTENIELSATDADGDLLTFSIPTNPGFLSITGFSQVLNKAMATLVMAPDETIIGNFDATVQVSDGQGGVDRVVFTIEVLEGYSLSDIVGTWAGEASNSNNFSLNLTVNAEGEVSGNGAGAGGSLEFSAEWSVDNEGKVTGSGVIFISSGGTITVEMGYWSLQLSADKTNLSGSFSSFSLGSMDVNLNKQ